MIEGLLFDECDRELVESRKWCVQGWKKHVFHTTGWGGSKPGTRKTTYLSREIIGAGPGEVVDHINCNPLDNRRCNLRIVTTGENSQNRKGANIGNVSGTRGVWWAKDRQKWRAQATVNYKIHHLGQFSSIEEAERVVVAFRLANMPGALS